MSPPRRIHPSFQTPIEARNSPLSVISDHVGVYSEIALDGSTYKLRVASANVLGPRAGSGFFVGNDWETEEQAKARYQKIIAGFKALDRDKNLDLLLIQETDPEVMQQLLIEATLGHKWEIHCGHQRGMTKGLVTLVNTSRLKIAENPLSSNFFKMRVRAQAFTFTFSESEFCVTFNFFNVWGMFDARPSVMEQRYRKLSLDRAEGVAFSIFAGDHNTTLDPAYLNSPHKLTTAVPLALNAGKGLSNDQQDWDLPDGVVVYDQNHLPKQQICSVFNLETGKIIAAENHFDNNPDALPETLKKHKLLARFDAGYGDADSACFVCEHIEQTINRLTGSAIGNTDKVEVYLTANAQGQKGIAVVIPDAEAFQHVHDHCEKALAGCHFATEGIVSDQKSFRVKFINGVDVHRLQKNLSMQINPLVFLLNQEVIETALQENFYCKPPCSSRIFDNLQGSKRNKGDYRSRLLMAAFFYNPELLTPDAVQEKFSRAVEHAKNLKHCHNIDPVWTAIKLLSPSLAKWLSCVRWLACKFVYNRWPDEGLPSHVDHLLEEVVYGQLIKAEKYKTFYCSDIDAVISNETRQFPAIYFSPNDRSRVLILHTKDTYEFLQPQDLVPKLDAPNFSYNVEQNFVEFDWPAEKKQQYLNHCDKPTNQYRIFSENLANEAANNSRKRGIYFQKDSEYVDVVHGEAFFETVKYHYDTGLPQNADCALNALRSCRFHGLDFLRSVILNILFSPIQPIVGNIGLPLQSGILGWEAKLISTNDFQKVFDSFRSFSLDFPDLPDLARKTYGGVVKRLEIADALMAKLDSINDEQFKQQLCDLYAFWLQHGDLANCSLSLDEADSLFLSFDQNNNNFDVFSQIIKKLYSLIENRSGCFDFLVKAVIKELIVMKLDASDEDLVGITSSIEQRMKELEPLPLIDKKQLETQLSGLYQLWERYPVFNNRLGFLWHDKRRDLLHEMLEKLSFLIKNSINLPLVQEIIKTLTKLSPDASFEMIFYHRMHIDWLIGSDFFAQEAQQNRERFNSNYFYYQSNYLQELARREMIHAVSLKLQELNSLASTFDQLQKSRKLSEISDSLSLLIITCNTTCHQGEQKEALERKRREYSTALTQCSLQISWLSKEAEAGNLGAGESGFTHRLCVTSNGSARSFKLIALRGNVEIDINCLPGFSSYCDQITQKNQQYKKVVMERSIALYQGGFVISADCGEEAFNGKLQICQEIQKFLQDQNEGNFRDFCSRFAEFFKPYDPFATFFSLKSHKYRQGASTDLKEHKIIKKSFSKGCYVDSATSALSIAAVEELLSEKYAGCNEGITVKPTASKSGKGGFAIIFTNDIKYQRLVSLLNTPAMSIFAVTAGDAENNTVSFFIGKENFSSLINYLLSPDTIQQNARELNMGIAQHARRIGAASFFLNNGDTKIAAMNLLLSKIQEALIQRSDEALSLKSAVSSQDLVDAIDAWKNEESSVTGKNNYQLISGHRNLLGFSIFKTRSQAFVDNILDTLSPTT